MRAFSGFLSIGALLTAMLLWGSSFVAFKYALSAYDPYVIVFARMVLATIVFTIALPLWKPQRIRRQDLPIMAFMALCEPCLYFIFEGQALTLTTASQAGMVSAILPLLVAVAAWFCLGENLAPRSWVGLALALIGVAWVSVSGQSTDTAPRPILGNVLELLGMICAAGYTVSMKKLCATYSPWFLTAVQAIVGMVFFFPILFLPSTELPTALPWGPSWAVLYLGVCISIGAYGFYNFGISKLPAWQASAFINLVPVFSILLGWLCLDEHLTRSQLCGAGVVFLGVLLSQERYPNAPNPVDASDLAEEPTLS